MAIIFGRGSSFRPVDDVLNGTPEDDQIYGRGGNDVIDATQGGNDFIITGDGDDTIDTGDGNDTIQAGGGDNTIQDTGGNNFVQTGRLGRDANTTDNIVLGSGDDQVFAGGGRNIVELGHGNNVYTGGSGGDEVVSGLGDDEITLGSHAEDELFQVNVLGTSYQTGNFWLDFGGSDEVYAGSADPDDGGTDVLYDDIFTLLFDAPQLAGDDVIVSGDGNDVVRAFAGNDEVDAGAGDDNIQTSLRYAGDDTVNAGAGDDFVFAGGGDDEVNGDAGADRLVGGDGEDILNGGLGQDVLFLENDGARDRVGYQTVNELASGPDFLESFTAGVGPGVDAIDLSEVLPVLPGGFGQALAEGYLSGGNVQLGDVPGPSALLRVDPDGATDPVTGEGSDFPAFDTAIVVGVDITNLTPDNFIFDDGTIA